MLSRGSRRLLLLAAALFPAAAAAAQDSHITLLHGFPLAGGKLSIVVDGLQPGTDTLLRLYQPTSAPLSVFEELRSSTSPQFRGIASSVDGEFTSLWRADERGRIVLEIALDNPGDVDHEIQLQAIAVDGHASDVLDLHVEAPMLVLPTADGYARLSLLDGAVLAPAIPAEGGLHGVSFSRDGERGYVLRDGGVLQVLATRDWAGAPLDSRTFEAAPDLLAGGQSGAAFLLSRPEGTPFPDAARALFLDEGSLRMEAMAQAVGGRRVALSEDGLSAFVAEDDLVVRELDLLARQPRALLPVGLAGDSAVADMLLDGRQLLVATRGAAGRNGSLTVFGLDDGRLTTVPLASDPARLVALGSSRVLVVPASGGVLEFFDHGLPAGSKVLAGSVLDAAPLSGGALVLSARDGQRRLSQLDSATLHMDLLLATVPAVNRLVGAPAGLSGVVVLLGDPSGAVHVWVPQLAALQTVADLHALPDAGFSLLP
jgi:hypothetical protein